MNISAFKTLCAVFLLVVAFSWPVRADQEGAAASSLAYPHFKVTPKKKQTPPADRPDNNVTAMPKIAREQFDRNEETAREELEEREKRDRDRDHDHDHDDDDDCRDYDCKKDRVRKAKWRSFTPGGFIPQASANTVNGKVIRKDIPGERRARPSNRHYSFDYRSRAYYYKSDIDYVPVVRPPLGFDSLTFDGVLYYYNDGQFYVPTNGRLLEVHPPLGAVVKEIPDEHVVIEYDGETYGIYDGVYYRKEDGGYEVIVPPFSRDDGVAFGEEGGELSIQLPDSRGRSSQVVLLRTGNGFLGPQGEYYTEFPPIEQLREMYGKRN